MKTVKLAKAEVLERLSVSERTLEVWVREKRFPEPVRIGKRCFWAEDVVDGYIEAQFNAQRQFVPGFGVLVKGQPLPPLVQPVRRSSKGAALAV